MVKLRELWNKKKVNGMIGLELEVESNTKLPIIDTGTWKTVRDPSLRSAFPFEYTTRSPIPFIGTHRSINNLLSRLNDKEVSDPIANSPTTSWHVHLNALEFTITELMTRLFLYWMIEPLVIKHCGTRREQNTFALQLKDSMYTLTRFDTKFYTDFISNPRDVVRGGHYSQENRYASQNMSALSKFGSVEYRAMKGTLNEEEIKMWTDLLTRIWECNTFNNPSEALCYFYDKGSTGIVEYLGVPAYTKYWTKGIEEECEENALALLQVDDAKLLAWELWERKIEDAHKVRSFSHFEEDIYETPPPTRSRALAIRAPIGATARSRMDQAAPLTVNSWLAMAPPAITGN